ncbi:DUF3817 domain-containing protein [Streptomyces sp. NBC_01104]|uniref:DUF3817 domain-containing protein n=1 Tax=Streptomyces sp. NBC_01104 TaxID=2903750 RepID=UPI00386B9B4D|nr:DUF3817 domain-containing protein [Streptomyces sp. NBC_01104]
MRTLRFAAAVEASSLALLLLNLFTVHTGMITSLGGLLHGTAYLTVIVTVFLALAPTPPGAKGCAFLPGIGGLLALRLLGRRSLVPPGTRDDTTDGQARGELAEGT